MRRMGAGWLFFLLLGWSAVLWGQAGQTTLPAPPELPPGMMPPPEGPPPPGPPPEMMPPPAGPTVEAPLETPTSVPAAPTAEQPTAPEDELVYLNVQDQDIKEVIKQISKATKRNFIIDDKVRGKVTIISEKMMTREEAYQAFLSALQVAGFTVVEGPGKILKIVSTRDAITFPIPTHVDTTPYTDSYVTRLIKMENISARDIADAISRRVFKNV